MVTEFGMSERLGPLSFGKRDELVFLGREIGEQRNYSDEVAKKIDEEVRAIIDRAYERATPGPETHRDKLEALAEKLVAEETVDARGVREALQRPAAEGEPPRWPPVIAPAAGHAGSAADRQPEEPPAPPGRRRRPTPRNRSRAARSTAGRRAPSISAGRIPARPEDAARPTTRRA